MKGMMKRKTKKRKDRLMVAGGLLQVERLPWDQEGAVWLRVRSPDLSDGGYVAQSLTLQGRELDRLVAGLARAREYEVFGAGWGRSYPKVRGVPGHGCRLVLLEGKLQPGWRRLLEIDVTADDTQKLLEWLAKKAGWDLTEEAA